jgi:hypothetical protein
MPSQASSEKDLTYLQNINNETENMAISTSFYYFTNDLFRLKGKRIAIKELDDIGLKYATRMSAHADKLGAPGSFSKMIFKNLGVDIMAITVEGDNEDAIRNSIRAVYALFGPYETKRGKEGELAKRILNEIDK